MAEASAYVADLLHCYCYMRTLSAKRSSVSFQVVSGKFHTKHPPAGADFVDVFINQINEKELLSANWLSSPPDGMKTMGYSYIEKKNPVMKTAESLQSSCDQAL